MKQKSKTGGFLSMLLGTLGANLLGSLSSGKGINRAGYGVLRTGYRNKKKKFDPNPSFKKF